MEKCPIKLESWEDHSVCQTHLFESPEATSCDDSKDNVKYAFHQWPEFFGVAFAELMDIYGHWRMYRRFTYGNGDVP